MTGFPRLIATDLDGTVVRADGTVSARVVAAFAAAERLGARVVFVTGRPPRLIHEIAPAFGHHGVAICSNGALVYDLGARRVVEEHAIPPEVLGEAAARLRAAAPGIGIAVEYAATLAADELYEPWDWDRGITLVRMADHELFGRPGPKLLGRHPTLPADELLALAAPELAPIVTVYHSNGSRLVEAIAAGVSKASALMSYAAGLGIGADEVVAFGDMPNDLPMLAWAGTSYGMANGHADVLAAVDHVIGSIDEDGVALELERLAAAVG
ncbi:HAD family hydrolase [Nonomuraea sp. NPDC059023]|uniref:HAD family hydrolase n=1 Tax=unclassified Nonomuraea TaxID=2593643 RepID=UPI0036ACAA6D